MFYGVLIKDINLVVVKYDYTYIKLARPFTRTILQCDWQLSINVTKALEQILLSKIRFFSPPGILRYCINISGFNVLKCHKEKLPILKLSQIESKQSLTNTVAYIPHSSYFFLHDNNRGKIEVEIHGS